MVFYLVFLAKKLSHLKMIIKLAQRRISNYNHLQILLTYNYKTFTLGRTNTNKRKLKRVDIPSNYSGD